MALVLLTGYGAFRTAAMAFDRSQRVSRQMGEPLALLQQMKLELASSFLPDPTGPPGEAANRAVDWMLLDREEDGLPADLLVFRSAAAGPLSYFIYQQVGRRGLVCRKGPTDQDGAMSWLSERIIGLDVRCHDGRSWQSRWDGRKQQSPELVEITFYYGGDSQEPVKLSQTVTINCRANVWVEQ